MTTLAPNGAVSYFTKQLAKEHELYLLKYALLTYNDEALCLGPMNEPPTSIPIVPTYVLQDRLTDSGDSYVLSRADQQGEAKIDRSGNLLGGRRFLFSTFTLPNRQATVYVLVRDILKCLDSTSNVNAFLQENPQLYGITANLEEIELLKKVGLWGTEEAMDNAKFVTAKSVFMFLGARVIVSGTRLVDDYWEQTAKEQGFLPHHRVFTFNAKLIEAVGKLKPQTAEPDAEISDSNVEIPDEMPYQIISEQSSWELKQDYARELSQGEHLSVIIPGQNITGSLELSAQHRLPKYYSKTSIQAAIQAGTEDTPIGLLRPTHNTAHPTSSDATSRNDKRLLSGILDSPVSSRTERVDGTQGTAMGLTSHDVPIHISGWKFDLPVTTDPANTNRISAKGLPTYDSRLLRQRLEELTPNQVHAMQHLHDAVFFNTGLQNARRSRKTKWAKYWQYKAGIPIGTTRHAAKAVMKRHLNEVANHVEVIRTLDEVNAKEHVKTIRRMPNPNFIGHSNITGLKPPYINQ